MSRRFKGDWQRWTEITRFRHRRAAWLLLMASLLGCGGTSNLISSLKPVYFQRQDEAGSIQVGVQSVAPFEEYVDALQPKFPLTEKDAFDAAIAQTQIENLREIRTLLGKIAVALPTTTTAVEKILNRQGDTTTSSRKETQTETPPTQPAAAAPADTSTLTGVPEAPAGTVAIDAALRYRAAAALFQDIALLSSYVREAAVARGTTPYIVRLLVTVLPSSHRAPYDAYTTVSFFLDTQDEYSVQPYLAEDATAFSAPERWRVGYQKLDPQAKDLKCDGRSIQVVPLFVTDNFESSSQATARESVHGIEATAGGTISNVGVGGGLNSKQDATLGTRGIDLNGIQTLAAASENTIQLRLGAVTVEGGYQSIPRTHNLTALILAPSQVVRVPPSTTPDCKVAGAICDRALALACGRVHFSAHSFFRLASKGPRLNSLQGQEMASEVEKQLQSEFNDNKTKYTKAIEAAQLFDFDQFKSSLNGKDERTVAAAWPKIVTLMSSWGRSGGIVPLPTSTFRFFSSDPMPGAVGAPAIVQPKIPIMDDGNAAKAVLYGAERLEEHGKGLHAQISFPCKGSQVGIDNDSVTVTQDRRGATFTFPSIKAFAEKIADPNCALPTLVDVHVDFSPTVQRWTRADQHRTYVAERKGCPVLVLKDEKKEDPKAEIDLRATTDFIRAKKDGTGEFAIEIRKTKKDQHTVLFTVEGAILQSAQALDGTKVDLQGVFRKGTTDNAYILSVKSLFVGRRVTVHTWQAGAKAEDDPISGPDISLIVVPDAEPLDCHLVAGRCPSGQ